MDRHQRPRPDRLPTVMAISADQAKDFAILRRPQTPFDLLPADRVDQFEQSGMTLRRGLNPGLARHALTPIGEVWIVPGNGHVALVANGGATCTQTDRVARQGLLLWGSSKDMRPNVVAHGLAPDGVADVTLFAAGEPLRFLRPGDEPTLVPLTLAVRENVYGAMLPGEFLFGRYEGPAGTVEFGPGAHRSLRTAKPSGAPDRG
jgi:hypothetical protein